MFLSKRCAELRTADRKKKTQMRFNGDDIEVLLKEKGTPEPYRVIEHKEICNVDDLPDYDHNQVWKVKRDRQPKTYQTSPNRGVPPSLSEIQVRTHPLSRETSMENAPRKKFRWNGRMEDDMEVMDNTETTDRDTEEQDESV